MKTELLKRILPLHVACVGSWRGTYTDLDVNLQVTARFQSLLKCWLPQDAAGYDFCQINRYTYPDGRIEEHEFPGRVMDGRMVWDNARIRGYAEELGDGRTILVKWVRHDLPREEFFEMIQLDEDVTHRSRVWARYRDGILVGRTLIDERRVSEA